MRDDPVGRPGHPPDQDLEPPTDTIAVLQRSARGRRLHPTFEDDLEEALDGRARERRSPISRRTRTSANGRLGSRLFETYVPFRVGMSGPVVGVIEVYQDYSVIQIGDRPADAHALDLARHRIARAVRRAAAADDRRHPDAPTSEPSAPGAGGPALRPVGARAGHRRRAPRARPDEERLRRRHVARAPNAAHQHPRLRPHPSRVGVGRRSGRGRGARRRSSGNRAGCSV